MTWTNDRVGDVAARLAAGAAATDEELAAVMAATDILSLAVAADEVRRRWHGTTVTYVRVATLPLPLPPGPVSVPPAAREIRVIGTYADDGTTAADLQRVVGAAGGVPVTGFSLAELVRAAEAARRPLGDLCASLRSLGMSAVAEVPLDELDGIETHVAAARDGGLAAARFTVTKHTDAAGRLRQLRRLQALAAAGVDIRSVAPLPRVWNPAAPSTGYDDIRQIAVARLALPAVPSIQVDWSLYGPKLAQVALTMGADDLDGVAASDDAPDGRRRAALEEVRRNILAAGFVPAERDGLFRRVGA